MNCEVRPIVGEIIGPRKPAYEPRSVYEVTSVDGRQLGGSFPKYKIEATATYGVSEKILHLVTKYAHVCWSDFFDKGMDRFTEAEKYYLRWDFLRRNGIPTLSSMRVVSRKCVVMGDMTIDGSEFFGKEKERNLCDETRCFIKRELTPMEEVFLKTDPKPIEDELERIQLKLFDLGVRLPEDDPFDLLMHPDGTWSALVVDLNLINGVSNKKKESGELANENGAMRGALYLMRHHLYKIRKD